MIHPDAASAYYPLLRGALSGMEFMKEPEPEDNKPFLMSLSHSNKIIVTDEPGRMNYGDENDQFIFVTPLKGTVLKHDAECGPRGTRTLASRMSTWDKNKQVIGHIIVTESGGGQAAGVPEMADAISNLTKPVVAWIDGMSASAAYYINSYCSHIMASRATDQIGCIGTLIQLHGFPKFAKLDDGSVVARIYADGADEKNEEFEKALEGNFTLIKERLLNPHNEQFKADVRSNRTAVLDEQLKGRTYNASDVVGTLIDSIGSFEDAIQKVIELSNSTKNNSKSNNSKKMEQLTNLNNIESVRDFEVTEGQASFNEQQLQDIESALAAGTQAASQVVTLTSENNTLRNDVTARDNRIAELEAALAGDGAHAAVESAAVNTDGILNPKPVDEFQSAKEFCENHLKSVK